MTTYNKPNIWCLVLHQKHWDEVDDDVYICKWCDVRFHYPTKKADQPVYRKLI